MESLESFIEEMLEQEIPKEIFLNGLLTDLSEQALPSAEKLQTGFDKTSNLHGLTYDYENRQVTISYKVIPKLHPPTTISFDVFGIIVEGLICRRRKNKW